MQDPVTIESGLTFERVFIEAHFETQLAKAKRVIANADSDNEEEKNLTESDFMTCPVTMKKVNPQVLISNK